MIALLGCNEMLLYLCLDFWALVLLVKKAAAAAARHPEATARGAEFLWRHLRK